MFESLADRMREDDHQEIKTSERVIRWIVVAVLSVLLFGGIYMGLRMVQW